MRTHDRFLETEVLSADPLTLVRMLYRGAIEALASARRHLADGNVVERARQIARTHAILHELSTSLDSVNGGEIAGNLRELYDYMQRQLNAANLQQADAPLADVESLLQNLFAAWIEIDVRPNGTPSVTQAPAAYIPVSLAG